MYNNIGDGMKDDFVITGIDQVKFVGREEYDLGKINFGANLKHNELIFHFSGQSVNYFNGKQFEISADTIRFLPKGENFEYVVVRAEKGECIDIMFDAEGTVSEEAFVMKAKKSEKIGNLFKKIFSVWVSKNDGYYFECISILYKIFSELQKESYLPENQYSAINPAVEYIEEHFLDGKISVKHLSDMCSVSESYLKKLFIRRFGMPPLKYVLHMKINYACDLLRSNTHSVSRVAQICGYDDIYYFSRQFKEYMGISPREFKNKYVSSK